MTSEKPTTHPSIPLSAVHDFMDSPPQLKSPVSISHSHIRSHAILLIPPFCSPLNHPPAPQSPPGYQARGKKAHEKHSRYEQTMDLPNVLYSFAHNCSILFSFTITAEHRVDGFLEPSGTTVRSHPCMVLLRTRNFMCLKLALHFSFTKYLLLMRQKSRRSMLNFKVVYSTLQYTQ